MRAAAGRSRSRPRAITGPAVRRSRRALQTMPTLISNARGAYPELFYGQLALERLGRSVPPPPQRLPQYVTTPAAARRVQQPPARPGDPAARPAGPIDRAGPVREGARANRSTTTPTAISRSQLGAQIGRQDLAGLDLADGAGEGFDASTCGRPIRCCPPPFRASCGRWLTASAARKARSIPMRSATRALAE